MSSSEQRAADSADDLDKPLTWEQIISLMFRWHVSAVRITLPVDKNEIEIHFREGSQWQTWHYRIVQ